MTERPLEDRHAPERELDGARDDGRDGAPTDRPESGPKSGAVGDTAHASPEQLAARIGELEQAHARALADYRNLERRTVEGRDELRRLTTAAVIINLLPVYDDLSRAIESVEDDIAGHRWVEGIQLIRDKFRGILDAAGARELEALGKPFDPRVHEAVGYAAGPDGHVVHVMQSGWAIGDHVVRPAMVMVGSGDAPTATNE